MTAEKHVVAKWAIQFNQRANAFLDRATSTHERKRRLRRLNYDVRFNMRNRGRKA